MTFQPSALSNHSCGCPCTGCTVDLGWSVNFPESSLTVSATARNYNLDNTPTAAARANLSRVSDFLATLPFEFTVNSAYRSPAVNNHRDVGGSRSSQHMSGEAVDISPTSVSKGQFAAWLWDHKDEIPLLDQIIVYTNTSHVHVSIGPRNRKQFLSGRKSGPYDDWYPLRADLDSIKHYAIKGGKVLKLVRNVVLFSMAAVGVYFGVMYARSGKL